MSSYGEAHAAEIARTLETYERLFAELTDDPVDLDRAGTEALERTAAFAPALADEIAEIARGAGIPIERIAALNARTEILASCRATTPRECSALVALRGAGGPVAVQTWDWQELADSWHVQTIEHADGRIVRTRTEHGIVGKIGVSSAGVGTLFTILKHARDGGPVGAALRASTRIREAYSSTRITSSRPSRRPRISSPSSDRTRSRGSRICAEGSTAIPLPISMPRSSSSPATRRTARPAATRCPRRPLGSATRPSRRSRSTSPAER